MTGGDYFFRKAELLRINRFSPACAYKGKFKRKHYNLVFAKNGEEALDYLKDNDVDLVLMDIRMPNKNGFEVVDELRKTKPHIKVIMVTGYHSSEIAHEAVKYDVSEYITKPFMKNTVMKIVQRILG